MKLANNIIRNILGDKQSKNKKLETRKEQLIKTIKNHMTNISDVDADSMANGLLSDLIPYIITGVGKIEVK